MENEDCEKCEATWGTKAYCCANGTLYGPCESEYCGGGCEAVGECECSCHR